MRNIRVTLSALLLFIVAMIASAAMPDESIESNIQQLLVQRFPGITIKTVQPSTVLPGFYEVVTTEEIAYTDAKASRLIVGNVMDTATGQNLTALRWNQLNGIAFESLPLNQAIKIVKQGGTRKLVVFADPLCPYCQQLEQNLKDLNDATIFVFLYPLEDVHPGATEVAQKIWCAPDRAAAWSAWMLNKVAPVTSGAACDTRAIAEIKNLGDGLRIGVTPTLFMEDGYRISGLVGIERLELEFSAVAERRHARASEGAH